MGSFSGLLSLSSRVQPAMSSSILSMHITFLQHMRYSGPVQWSPCPASRAGKCTTVTCPHRLSANTVRLHYSEWSCCGCSYVQLAKNSNVLSMHVICSQYVHYSGPFLWLSCPVKYRALAKNCTAIICPSIDSLSTQHACIIASGHLACCGHV